MHRTFAISDDLLRMHAVVMHFCTTDTSTHSHANNVADLVKIWRNEKEIKIDNSNCQKNKEEEESTN